MYLTLRKNEVRWPCLASSWQQRDNFVGFASPQLQNSVRRKRAQLWNDRVLTHVVGILAVLRAFAVESFVHLPRVACKLERTQLSSVLLRHDRQLEVASRVHLLVEVLAVH